MFKQRLSGSVTALASLLLVSLFQLAMANGPAGHPGPRPVISQYPDENAFVKELLAWETRMKQWRAHAPSEPPSPPSLAPDQKDWHLVSGPEDLHTAVNNARGYQQPRYQEKKRFNRSTHLSFPLPPLPQDRLADQIVETTAPSSPALLPSIPDPLNDKDTLTPDPIGPQQAISFTPPEHREVSTRMR